MTSPSDTRHPVYPSMGQHACDSGPGRAPFYHGSHFSPQNAWRDLEVDFRYKIGQLETALQHTKIQLAESKVANDFLLGSLVVGKQGTDSNVNDLKAEINALKQQNLVLTTELTSAKLSLNHVEAKLTLAKVTIHREKKKNVERFDEFSRKNCSSSNSLKPPTFSPKAPSSLSPGHASDSSQPQGNVDSLLDFGSDQEGVSPGNTLVPEEITPPSQPNTGTSYPFDHLTTDNKSNEDPEQRVVEYKVSEQPEIAKSLKLPRVELVNQPRKFRQQHHYIHYSFAEDTKASSTTPTTQSQSEPDPAPLINFGSANSVIVAPVSASTSSGSESAHISDSERGPKDSPKSSTLTAPDSRSSLRKSDSKQFRPISRDSLSASTRKSSEQKLDRKLVTRVFQGGLGASAWNAFADHNGFQAVARGIQPPLLEDRPPPHAARLVTNNDAAQEFLTTPLYSGRFREARRLNQPKDAIFDSPIEQQRTHRISQRTAGYSDLLDPAFFAYNILYNPPASAINVYRTVIIDNLPIDITLTEVLQLVTTGPLLSVHLLDTRSITKSMTVYLVFLEEDSATSLATTQSSSPLIFHSRPARVTLLRTPTTPLRPVLQNGIFNGGWTRCVAIMNAPKDFTPELCRSIIAPAPLRRDWIVNMKMHDRNAAIVIHFETLEAAEWALRKLRQTDMLEGSSVRFARDPCDGGFEEDADGEVEEESSGEAGVEAHAVGGNEEQFNQPDEGEWEECEDVEAAEDGQQGDAV